MAFLTARRVYGCLYFSIANEEKEGRGHGELQILNFKLADPSKQPMVRLLISKLFTPSESNLKYVFMFLEKIFLKQLLAL